MKEKSLYYTHRKYEDCEVGMLSAASMFLSLSFVAFILLQANKTKNKYKTKKLKSSALEIAAPIWQTAMKAAQVLPIKF